MLAGSAIGITVRLEAGSTRRNTIRMARQWCSGKTGGDSPGIVPEEAFRVACGRAGWTRATGGPAGRCTNRTPSQPRQSGAEIRRENEVPVPAENELPLPAESEKYIPEKNTPGSRHGPLWTVGLACQMGGAERGEVSLAITFKAMYFCASATGTNSPWSGSKTQSSR
jgi:hypothetical protein